MVVPHLHRHQSTMGGQAAQGAGGGEDWSLNMFRRCGKCLNAYVLDQVMHKLPRLYINVLSSPTTRQ